jgi:hypothetical protein
MSIEAVSWALNDAPDFAEEDPRQRPHLAIVLIGLANHAADPQGRNAFPPSGRWSATPGCRSPRSAGVCNGSSSWA